MKTLRFFLLLGCATLFTLVLSALSVRNGPDLFLVAVFDVARRGLPIPAMLAGLAAGLLEDGLSSPERLLGLHAFSKVLLGYLVATLGARMLVEKPFASGLLVGAATLVETGVVLGLLAVLRDISPSVDPAGLALKAASTAALGSFAQALINVPWKDRLEARRRRRLS